MEGSWDVHRVHINPKFGSKVHINPKFNGGNQSSSTGKNVHLNPKFMGRSLPPVPHLNPGIIDPSKAKSYQDSIQRVVEIRNPVQSIRKVPSRAASFADPEALKLVRITNPITTPSSESPRKKNQSTFKKIGSRKLIRLGSKFSESKRKKTSESFKKIGTRKLIRKMSFSKKTHSIKENAADTSSTSPLIYKVKKPNKIIKEDKRVFPRIGISSLASKKRRTPSVSPKAIPRRKTAFSSLLNPFKLDRRRSKKNHSNNIVTRRSKSASPIILPFKSPPLKSIPQKTPVKTNLITVHGVKYNVFDNGKKLKRLEDIPPPSYPVSKKLFLDGEEYVENEPGLLVRSRNSLTRQSITNYRNKSINTILKSQSKSKQYCMFYNKFGKCNKKEKGSCPYIHDPNKIAVCRKFLQGFCRLDKCLLSHKVAPEKMPSCKFFLEGLCTKEICPYRHVKVNEKAIVCQEYLKGFCPDGNECKKLHRSSQPKTKENIVPKEKVRQVSDETVVTVSQSSRYFQDPVPKPSYPESGRNDSEYEKRRKRLMKKIELAKAGWSGVATVENSDPEDLDDSGPYEEIDDEENKKPMDSLPSFISLSRYESDSDSEDNKENEEYQERLI